MVGDEAAAVRGILEGSAVVGDPGVIKVLERALDLARRGRLRGVVVIQALGSEQVGFDIAGGHLPALVAGASEAQRRLADQLFNPAARHGVIMPAGRG